MKLLILSLFLTGCSTIPTHKVGTCIDADYTTQIEIHHYCSADDSFDCAEAFILDLPKKNLAHLTVEKCLRP